MSGSIPKREHPLLEDSFGKRLVVVFLVCVAAYFALYFGDRHLRMRKGPWRLVFQVETNGTPSVEVSQPSLGVRSLKLVFPGEKAPEDFSGTKEILCNAPMLPIPFGNWLFDDLMYLPGTVVLNLFGHGVQLLPREATLDGKSLPWQSEQTVVLTATNKVPFAPPKVKR